MSGTDLRTRAAAGGQVARPGGDIRTQIKAMEDQFKLALPRGADAAQLVRDALTVISQNPELANCDPTSVLGGLMTMAQLGLRPGVLGHGWLLPFGGKGRNAAGQKKAQLVIGYQGLLALAQRSGDIASIQARVVHQGDHFDYAFGLLERLEHRPGSEQGPATHYYCVIKSTRGGSYWDVITRREAEEHRDKFAMAKDRNGNIVGPWRDHFDSMALKTVIKRVLKLAPASTELVTALGADESMRVDLGPSTPLEQAVWHEPIVGEATDLPTAPPAAFDPATGVIADDVDEAALAAAWEMDGAEAAAEGL